MASREYNTREAHPSNRNDRRDNRYQQQREQREQQREDTSTLIITQSLPIPEYKMGWITGKNGTYINQLSKKSGASITISDSKSMEFGTVWKYVQISGTYIIVCVCMCVCYIYIYIYTFVVAVCIHI